MKCQHFQRRSEVKKIDRAEEILTLWRDMAIAVAGSDNCVHSSRPAEWATKCIDQYANVLIELKKQGGL